MEKRIIIGKNNDCYYYSVRQKVNNEWIVIDSRNEDASNNIEALLDIEITAIRNLDNLLFVKTNDDLVVIENYSQLNHDKVFKSLNEKIAQYAINKNIMKKNMALQKKSNHKKAILNPKVLFTATIIGMLLLPPAMSIVGDSVIEPSKSVEVVMQQEMTPKEIVEETPTPVIEKETIEEEVVKPTISPEEKNFQNKVKEYSSMYYIDYNRAMELINKNKEEIKNNYINQEVGIIRVLAQEHYNDSSISKKVIVSTISSLEREKLLLKFAQVYEINDIETIATMLAVYRLETGNGESDACIYRNNYGGLRGRDSNGEYYLLSFKTPEIGAEAQVNNFLSIKRRARESNYYKPSRSLAANMNHIYCGERSWSVKVDELKKEVISEYSLSDYIVEEKGKQLIK